jgi:hypothetical protein
VVGSNHLIDIIGTYGLEFLVSNMKNVIMRRDTFNRLNSTGLIDNINKIFEDGDIKVIDPDADMIKNIMDRYDHTSEDSEILAAATISEVKEVLITSPELEKAVNDMGLKPAHLLELKMGYNK